MSDTDEAGETGEVAAEPTGLPFYSRLAIGGLLTIVAMTLVLAVVQVGSGDTSGVPFIVIMVAIALIVAGLVWRFGHGRLCLAP